MNFEIPNLDLNDWLNGLRPYQKNLILEMLKSEPDHEKVAMGWLNSNSLGNTVPFGGEQDPKPFWDKFKLEFRKFICGDKAYDNERSQLAKEAPISSMLAINAISGALGATIGYSATFLAPAVAILLYSISKMGVNAYCQTN
ncbi:MAG TPA: hypothetical protein PKM56_19110 [Candidatus Rifleibacterium sp.]|nr:hypothetical protein [Candidatus Rifleibacterium sp.]